MNELKNRGTQDILIAVVDGLKGFPEAITAAFPEAMVQTCIVGSLKKLLLLRLVAGRGIDRRSLRFSGSKALKGACRIDFGRRKLTRSGQLRAV